MFERHLKNAMREEGCPLCRLQRAAETQYIFHTLWENVSDVTFRLRFLASDGLCPDHAWQFQATEAGRWHDGLGTAILYESLLAAVIRGISRRAENYRETAYPWWHPFRWLRPAEPTLPPPGLCPVCQVGRNNDRFYTSELAVRLRAGDWREAYQGSDGLCLPHLQLLLAKATGETKTWLLNETETRLNMLRHDLKEYIRKHAWQYHEEPIPEDERRSWIRAVAFLRGEKPAAKTKEKR